MRLVVIGGSDAGISAALGAREMRTDVEVTVVVADAYPNFSICGLPFYVSGETTDWYQLAHRTLHELEDAGLTVLLNHTAVAIGLDMPGVYVLHTVDDSFRVRDHLESRQVRDVAIVGSGYIGLEMADALTHRGARVRLFGRAETVLPSLDRPLGLAIADELRRHGVAVHAGVAVEAIERVGDGLSVAGTRDERTTADLVVVAAGVRPNSQLAVATGVESGTKGAIRVDRHMATNLPDVYAAGDCVETWHRVLQSPTYLPLGTTAHKQGRVAGENAVGGYRVFEGSIGTQVVKVFDLAIARTGLGELEAREAGFDPFTVQTEAWDHKAYYPGAHQMCLRVTGDRQTGQLLGAQILGPWQAEVAKRIDVYATALFAGMTVDGINDLDLSYTPPFGSPWDAVQLAAQAWASTLAGGQL